MTIWDQYPNNYRAQEVQFLLAAADSGECASIIGLSGAGKSNLMGFLAHRAGKDPQRPAMILVDCNRLFEPTPQGFFRLVCSSLEPAGTDPGGDGLARAETLLTRRVESGQKISLLFDRFEAAQDASLASSLRALRDRLKYSLTYITATRQPLQPATELSELFYGSTLWLGPLTEGDARWSIQAYAIRKRLHWEEITIARILAISGRYPSFLRALCEAAAGGAELNLPALLDHPAVQQRLREFWDDRPGEAELLLSGLKNHPLLQPGSSRDAFDPTRLTQKENLLWEYFTAHPEQVNEKDALIQAVWPEDRIQEQGIRDDSLAQLIRRLREKIEPDPSNPSCILTVPGRGYRYLPNREPGQKSGKTSRK